MQFLLQKPRHCFCRRSTGRGGKAGASGGTKSTGTRGQMKNAGERIPAARSERRGKRGFTRRLLLFPACIFIRRGLRDDNKDIGARRGLGLPSDSPSRGLGFTTP